jgi:phage terminase large subunit-like protein
MAISLKKRQSQIIDNFLNKKIHINTNPVFSPQAKQRRINAGYKSEEQFIRQYSPDFEVVLNEMHKWIIEKLRSNGLYVVAGSRMFGKTWLAKMLIIRMLCYQLISFPGILSRTLEHAELILFSIETMCKNQNNLLLQHDFELFDKIIKPPKISGLIINDVFLKCYSHKASTRGDQGGTSGIERLDFLFTDDWEDYATSKNPDLNYSKYHSIKAEVYPSMGLKIRRMLWVGNLVRSNCAMNLYFQDDPNSKNNLIFPCFDKNGKSQWEKVISTQMLNEERKRLGEIVFSTEFLQKPIDGNGLYHEDVLHFDEYRHFKDKLVKVIQWHDPSFSQKKEACFRACVTLGVDENGRLYLLAIRCSQISYLDFFAQCYEDYKNFAAETFYYENNGKQWDRSIQHLWDEFEYKNQMTIREDFSEGNKDLRIENHGLEHALNKNLTINASIRHSKDFQEWLLQYLNFPNGKKDALDAFTGACIRIASHNIITKPYRPNKKRVSFYDQ